MKRYAVPLGIAALAGTGLLALLVTAWIGRGAEEVAAQVEARLSEALSAECRVGSARILSTRQVRLRSVGCLFDDGPVIGIGIGEAEVHFERPPLGGPLPPIELFSADDLDVRVRQREALSALRGDDSSAPESEEVASEETEEVASEETEETAPTPASDEEDEDLSLGLEREIVRFLEFVRAVDEGSGGENLPLVLDRLGPEGAVRVDRTTVEDDEGNAIFTDLHARLNRVDQGLSIAAATQLGPAGGVAAFDGTLTSDGLRAADIRVERLPVAKALSRMTGTALEVADGVVSGQLSYRPGTETGDWSIDLEFLGLLVHKDSIGRDWLPLPPVQLRGSLLPNPEERTLTLGDASWSVAETGGELEAFLGPLGLDEPPRFDVRLSAARLRLGRLLAALPDSLMPASWAEELQGTMLIEASFQGPLHQREKWDLDWETDFSQMLLASGSLAQQVERLKGPFEHVFPVQKDGRVLTRIMGPEDESFVPIEDVSRYLINAVLSTEDSGFFRHSGFEEASIKEAMLENLREGEGRGGSTITQQLAKNLFLSGERTFARKLKEAVIAWRLEAELPKERILEIYMNIAEWGPGIFGARDGSRHYFDRRPSRLRPEQAAFLASLLPSPVRYHGYYHPRGLTHQRFRMVQRILHTMHSHGRLTNEDYHLARGASIGMTPCTLPPAPQN